MATGCINQDGIRNQVNGVWMREKGKKGDRMQKLGWNKELGELQGKWCLDVRKG